MSTADIDELLEAKSRELQTLQERKVHALNREIEGLTLQLNGCREQHTELKESFEYNLNLLAERDTELEKYDDIITELNSRITQFMAEISDMKVSLAGSQQELLQEKAMREELIQTFQQRLKDMELNFEQEYRKKEQEVKDQLTENARIKQQLELQLSHLEEDRERTQRELERNFEDEIARVTRELSSKTSELQTKLFQAEQKLKHSVTEVESLRMSNKELQETIIQQDRHIQDMEEAVSQAEWEVKGYINLQQKKMKDLEGEVVRLKHHNETREKVLSNKSCILENRLQEKEHQVEALHQTLAEKEASARQRILTLESEYQELKMSSVADLAKYEEKVNDVTKALDRAEQLLQERNIEIETQNQKVVRGEVNLKMLQDQQDDLLKDMQVDLETKKQDITKYKAELLLATKREEALRGEHEQAMKLMMMKCEKADSRAYGTQEDLFQDLTNCKNRAEAEAKKLKVDLMYRDDEIRLLRSKISQNNTLTSPLPPHSENHDQGRSLPEVAAEMELLQDQNAKLRDIVKQMTSDMEELAAANRSSRKFSDVSRRSELRDAGVNTGSGQSLSEDDEPDPNRMAELREEVMFLRRTITSLKDKALEQEDIEMYKVRILDLERERDRLLELSNGLRSKLLQFESSNKPNTVPLQEITSRLQNLRSSLTSEPHKSTNRRLRSGSSGSHLSLLHLSGDTTLNEELSDIARMVATEERRALIATPAAKDPSNQRKFSAVLQVVVTGRRLSPQAIPAPSSVIGKRTTKPKPKAKPKIRNYNIRK